MKLNKLQEVSIFFMMIIFFLIIVLKGFYFTSVSAQGPEGTTTANVTIMGYLDDIIVEFYPVNFTPTGIDGGLAPGIDDYPKFPQRIGDQAYINITTGLSTNVNYNISINATNMTDSYGHYIPANEIKINGTGNCEIPLTELSGELQMICQEIPPRVNITVYFFLDVPVGQYNNTYNGNLTIYVHSYSARKEYNNRTWFGENNTTARIKPTIEIVWDLKPIGFGTLIPDVKAIDALPYQGFPTNISSTPNTNVYIDLYINGTNLYNLADPTRFIGSDNVTYVDAPDVDDDGYPDSLPYDYIPLKLNLPTISSPDFPNWAQIPNNTYRLSWWNITIPPELIAGEATPGGFYEGDVRAKAVDAGYAPS